MSPTGNACQSDETQLNGFDQEWTDQEFFFIFTVNYIFTLTVSTLYKKTDPTKCHNYQMRS